MLTYIITVIGFAAAGFIAGILVGRRNTKKVEAAVAAYEKATNVITGILK